MALITGLGIDTIAKDRGELESPEASERIRRLSGGRPRTEKKDPAILTALEQLLADHTAGDPCGAFKWKHKSLRCLSAALADQHPASPPTVSCLLGLLGYSRKVNCKALAPSSLYRNEQFEYLQAQKQAFFERGLPVILLLWVNVEAVF